jgi:Fe-S cluster assembly protein SufD
MTLSPSTADTPALLKLGPGQLPNEPEVLTRRRKAALETLGTQGLPTLRNEAWRYTSLSGLAKIPFQRSATVIPDAAADPGLTGAVGAAKLVFVNGQFAPLLSSTGDLPAGVRLTHLLSAEAKTELNHLGDLTPIDEGGFSALNQSAFQDGALLHVPAGVKVPRLIHLLFLSQEQAAPAVVFPRVSIVLESDAEASVLEEHFGRGEGNVLSSPVTEVRLAVGAKLTLYKIQRESGAGRHLASTFVEQAERSDFSSHFFSLGGGLVRNEIQVRLSGEKAACVLNGLFVGKDSQHIDNYTFIDHRVSNCTSREMYKGVLDGKSTGVFFGRVRVEKDSQKTDARQSNKNLVLSADATINTRPQLEIYADDVKCSHGATIGQLDETALFYLRSRGIGPDEARQMLTFAFASEMVDEVKDPSVKVSVSDRLHEVMAF